MEVITTETVHLKEGRVNPPRQKGILRLYSMRCCPFSKRVRLVLLAKNVVHEIVNIHLRYKPDWFLQINPRGRVPTLDVGKRVLVGSLNITDYLEETYPEPKLYPENSKAKEHDKLLIQKFNKVIQSYYVIIYDKQKPLSKRINALLPLLEEYDKELNNRGNYFSGSTPGMVDYMIWPFVEHFKVLGLIYHEKSPFAKNQLGGIREWRYRMQQQNIIKNTHVSAELIYNCYYLGSNTYYDSI